MFKKHKIKLDFVYLFFSTNTDKNTKDVFH